MFGVSSETITDVLVKLLPWISLEDSLTRRFPPADGMVTAHTHTHTQVSRKVVCSSLELLAPPT